jgi:hypothetical protein
MDLDQKMEEGRAARERRRQEHVTQDLSFLARGAEEDASAFPDKKKDLIGWDILFQ